MASQRHQQCARKQKSPPTGHATHICLVRPAVTALHRLNPPSALPYELSLRRVGRRSVRVKSSRPHRLWKTDAGQSELFQTRNLSSVDFLLVCSAGRTGVSSESNPASTPWYSARSAADSPEAVAANAALSSRQHTAGLNTASDDSQRQHGPGKPATVRSREARPSVQPDRHELHSAATNHPARTCPATSSSRTIATKRKGASRFDHFPAAAYPPEGSSQGKASVHRCHTAAGPSSDSWMVKASRTPSCSGTCGGCP